ncbi:hypothetical protein DFP72DRAFT_808075 [Ephemerocybe angulata]|uniref:Uncharacterized protein n=1 Tax=Ephemerocybe angulata TaxID=980116 RepID=A0A8H6I416_9AGAR|nr:hypothetical protein DFP72DRAFT_808075 [Tulosesus angulatus]
MDHLPYSPPSAPYCATGPNQPDQAYPSQLEANPPYGNTNVVGLPPLETIDPAILAARFRSFLPIDFPQHLDSMLSELFPTIISQSIPSSDAFTLNCRPLIMLDMLRQASLTLHRGDVEETPTMFSYATVSQYPLKITHFGVTAPRQTSLGRGLNMAHGLGKTVRAFRVRNGWNVGGYPVPPATELWRHGHCAEMQAIPAVVYWCENLGMKNVVIYSLAMHKSGKETHKMCENCIAYIRTRVLANNPSWVVVDHLPDDFPPHQDSMLAELFPNLLSQSFPSSFISRFNPLILVNMLRCESIALHSWDPEDSGRTPTVFSYAATVSHYPLNITRFGVSVGNGSTGAPGLGDAVRAYRIRRWNAGGASVPPQPMYEPWKHGNCAEMQSIPPVVEWCESHGLENVVIFSLAMHKSGKKMPTCANCITYIYGRVLKSNPSWVVVDASTGMGFTSRGAMLPGIWPQYWLGSQAAGGR